MIRTLALLVALTVPVSLCAKHAYQDATFIGYEIVPDGVTCSTNGSVDDDGTLQAKSHCKPKEAMQFKISVNAHIYTLQKIAGHPKLAVATLGYSEVAASHGVLSAATTTNTTLQIYFEKSGEVVHVRIDKKESRYRVVPGTTKQ